MNELFIMLVWLSDMILPIVERAYYLLIFIAFFLIIRVIIRLNVLEKKLNDLLNTRNEVVKLEMYFLINGKWENSQMAKGVVKAGEVIKAKLIAKDGFGNVAKLDGAPVWSSADPHLLVTAAEDGMSAEIKSDGVVVLSKVSAVGDADLGPDKKDVIAEGDIEVVAGDAVALEMSFE